MDEIAKEVLINSMFRGQEATRQVLLPESKEYQVNIINFGKGVRNKFHTHNSEQILIITAGKGVVATEKEEKVVTVGDIVLIPAGEKHWHGSRGDSEVSHIVIVGYRANGLSWEWLLDKFPPLPVKDISQTFFFSSVQEFTLPAAISAFPLRMLAVISLSLRISFVASQHSFSSRNSKKETGAFALSSDK